MERIKAKGNVDNDNDNDGNSTAMGNNVDEIISENIMILIITIG